MLDGYGYQLALANGQKWVIVPTQRTAAWVEEWARILRLKKTDSKEGASVIIVCNRPRKQKKSGNYINSQKWGAPDIVDIDCEIWERGNDELKYMKMLQFFHVFYKRILDGGGFTCHGALVQRDGKGYILSGPGGIGKSTCCRRLPYPWIPLCDDEVLIVRHKQKGYCAHPLPTWSNYILQRNKLTWDVERYISVAGVFFLSKAHKDQVSPIGPGQAVVFLKYLDTMLLTRTKVPEKVIRLRRKLVDNVCEFSKHVPAFGLSISRSGRFWKKMEEAIGAVRNR